jgi:lysophospholipase L1-like esterase
LDVYSEIIPIINRVAKKNHLEVIDLHTPIDDQSLFIGDGIHPNADGAKKMADIISKTIAKE